MKASVQATQSTLRELQKSLADARTGLANTDPAMKRVAVFLDAWVMRNFRDQGAAVGGWEPFKYGGRVTVKSKSNAKSADGKRYINTTAKLLMNTGALRISFLPFIRQGAAGIGSELPYSAAHNDGMPAHNLPQRRILPIDDDVRVDVLEILNNFVRVTVGATEK